MSRWVSYSDAIAAGDASRFRDWLDRYATVSKGITLCSIDALSRQHTVGYVRVVQVECDVDPSLPVDVVARALVSYLRTDQRWWIAVVMDGIPHDVDN